MIDDRPDGTLRTFTFAQLNARSNQLANVLLELGVSAGRLYALSGADRVVTFGDADHPGAPAPVHRSRRS